MKSPIIPPPPPPPPPAPAPECAGGYRYWRDGQPDLLGAAAFAAATADLGNGGDDDSQPDAALNLEWFQRDLRVVIVRAKKLKDDMYATLIDGSLSQFTDDSMDAWITPFDTLIMDAQDDLKQGLSAISKIYDELVEACDEWEETEWDTGSETDNPVVS